LAAVIYAVDADLIALIQVEEHPPFAYAQTVETFAVGQGLNIAFASFAVSH